MWGGLGAWGGSVTSVSEEVGFLATNLGPSVGSLMDRGGATSPLLGTNSSVDFWEPFLMATEGLRLSPSLALPSGTLLKGDILVFEDADEPCKSSMLFAFFREEDELCLTGLGVLDAGLGFGKLAGPLRSLSKL